MGRRVVLLFISQMDELRLSWDVKEDPGESTRGEYNTSSRSGCASRSLCGW